MTNLTINNKARTIEMTKKFEKAASRFGSDEYKALQEARKDYPTYKVIVKASTAKSKESFKGLTYEYSLELTDKTQPLYELIKTYFQLKRPMDGSSGKRQCTGRNTPLLDKVSEESLRQEMTDKQQTVFDDLKTQSSDCSREQWFSIGIDIFHVFGAELGGKVFRWWSAPGHSFQPQGCARTWENICSRGPKTELKNSIWMELVAESAF